MKDEEIKEITDRVSKNMIGGIETVEDYGRKCAEEGYLLLEEKYNKAIEFIKKLSLSKLDYAELSNAFLIEDGEVLDSDEYCPEEFFGFGRESATAGIAIEARNVLSGLKELNHEEPSNG